MLRLLLGCMIATGCWQPLLAAPPQAPSAPALPPAAPRENSARVVIMRDPFATEAFRPDTDRVRGLVAHGVMLWTKKTNETAAWLSIVSTNDIVGIKVHSAPGPNSGTRVAVARAVVQGLLRAGIHASNIIVWDKHAIDLRLAGFYELADSFGIRVESASHAGYDSQVFYEHAVLGSLVYGDLEFRPGDKRDITGRKSYLTKLLTQTLTKVINIAPMLNHNTAGVAGNIYSMVMGSADNSARFEGGMDRMGIPLPEIYNLPAIADKVALCIADGLICQYEGGERALLHYAAPLNELRFSADPVALDVLSIQEITRLREENSAPKLNSPWQIYRNAELLELGIADSARVSLETNR